MFSYTDGLLEAKEVLPGWVGVFWLYPGQNKFMALKTLKRLEKQIAEAGYEGWLADSEYQYHNMHKVLIKFGCFPYAGDAERIYFKKRVNSDE